MVLDVGVEVSENPKRNLKLKEVADICGLCVKTIDTWIDRGRLRGHRKNPKGNRTVTYEALETFIDTQKDLEPSFYEYAKPRLV